MGRTGVRIGRRAVLVGTLVALTTGCGSGTPTNPSTPGSTGTADPRPDLRARLADALRPVDPQSADLVAEPVSTLSVVPTDWLPGWQVVDVQNARLAHPRRFFAGLSPDGTVAYLTGHPEAFDAMVRAAGVRVDDAGTAGRLVAAHLDSTRAFRTYFYRVASTADIAWLPDPTADQRRARHRLERAYADRVAEPSLRRSGDGWTLHVWMVDGQTLVDHTVTVAADGGVADEARVAERDLPVPVSV